MKSLKLTLLFLFAACLWAAAQTREARKVENFTRVSFRLAGKLYLKQGNTFKVELEGHPDFLKEVETYVEGNRLVIGKEGRWMDWNWGSQEKLTAYVTMPEIEGLSVSGSGDLIGETKIVTKDLKLSVSGSGALQIENDSQGTVEADVSGSGRIELRGKCQNFTSDVSGSGRVLLAQDIRETADFGISGSGRIEATGKADKVETRVSGSGKVMAAGLEANRCAVRISGSGDVEINVKNDLDAHITGSGSVRYLGNPNRVNSHASGSGKVRKM
jgi:hypothetical protein